ncbi:MAG: head GIN domain-containing protein [Pseudomonadota bacterium]
MAKNMHSGRRALSVLSALVLTGALGLAFVPAQAQDFLGSKTVTGSGQVGSVKRELGAFHRVSVDLPCKIELIQGSSEGIAIEAEQNLLPHIETSIKNGQLYVRVTKGITLSSRSPIKVTLNARNLDSLALTGGADLSAARLQSPKLNSSIAGSGSITIKDLQSKDLSVSVAGSGRFEAQGSTDAMDISIAGSGDISAPRLSAQDVSISIAGSGDATVWARKALSVNIVGSGNVRYYGEATRGNSSTVGSGSVKQLGANPPG